jgi:glycosyltransferase involved in cell wall biosynthesis
MTAFDQLTPSDTVAPEWPDISVVMPLRNGARDLRHSVGAVLSQDYPGRLELIIAVGPSDDDSEALARQLAEADDRMTVVDNPPGTTPSALNAAIAASGGAVVARVDSHAVLPPGYLRRAVHTLQTTAADNVGGVQHACGQTPFEQAVAAAMTSRFGVGNAAFHYGGRPGPTDTVYLGVFRRAALERVGGFDERLRRNQDYELNWRIRDSGGVVWFDPRLVVDYRPRSSLPALARQYREYGRYKRAVVRQHPRSLRARQLAAPAALIANASSLILATTGRRRFLVVPGGYLLATAVASALAGNNRQEVARLPLVFATMHHAWGWGFLVGR